MSSAALRLDRKKTANGATRAHTPPKSLLEKYRALLETVRSLPGLAGFCYTQFADTYQEANGLLHADRTPKVPFEEIAEATVGPEYSPDAFEDSHWRGPSCWSANADLSENAKQLGFLPA